MTKLLPLRGWPAAALGRVGVAFALGLAACTTSPVLGTMGVGALQTSTQFTVAQMNNAWVAPAGGLVAIHRQLGSESEQIIGLVNNTTLEGDNFLWLRARGANHNNPGRFKLDDFIARVGGVPSPFGGLSDRDLRSGEDALGPFFWLEYRAGAQTNCVLAIRRIDGSRRILPRGTNVLEIMLRNCVQGSVEEALNPIRDSQIGVGAVGAVHSATGGTRMLSPLAAPSPAP